MGKAALRTPPPRACGIILAETRRLVKTPSRLLPLSSPQRLYRGQNCRDIIPQAQAAEQPSKKARGAQRAQSGGNAAATPRARKPAPAAAKRQRSRAERGGTDERRTAQGARPRTASASAASAQRNEGKRRAPTQRAESGEAHSAESGARGKDAGGRGWRWLGRARRSAPPTRERRQGARGERKEPRRKAEERTPPRQRARPI